MALNNDDRIAVDIVEKHMHVLQEADTDFDPLLTYIGDASLVLLGEATHGTREFYRARIEITKRLIREKGFNLIAIEGDWPDTFRVNQYVKGVSDSNAQEALGDFKRFPSWMWRNQEVADFIEWLRMHNSAQQTRAETVGFFGIDLYSLHSSMEAVVTHLESVNAEAAQKARERYSCFDAFMDPQYYGHYATLYPTKSCQEKVLEQLVDLRKKELSFYTNCALDPRTCQLYVEQNARVVANAERYYRSLFEGRPPQSWNIRDTHMADTIDTLRAYGTYANREAKIIVWAHNSHLGNARATQMSVHGELNVGQLLKERYGNAVVSVGFSTYEGMVSAASSWGASVERKRVRSALEGSYEALFHALPFENLMLFTHEDERIKEVLSERLQRAIGVIYLPERERSSHYFMAYLPDQFDVIIHYDTTHAVDPLDKTEEWVLGELPETYPFGI